MHLQPIAPSRPDLASVDPSRAWIVGLVAGPDGTLIDADAAEPEWPATRDAGPDPTTTTDGPAVRPQR